MNEKYGYVFKNQLNEVLIEEVIQFVCQKIASKEMICLIKPDLKEIHPDFFEFIQTKKEVIEKNTRLSITTGSLKSSVPSVLNKFEAILQNAEKEFIATFKELPVQAENSGISAFSQQQKLQHPVARREVDDRLHKTSVPGTEILHPKPMADTVRPKPGEENNPAFAESVSVAEAHQVDPDVEKCSENSFATADAPKASPQAFSVVPGAAPVPDAQSQADQPLQNTVTLTDSEPVPDDLPGEVTFPFPEKPKNTPDIKSVPKPEPQPVSAGIPAGTIPSLRLANARAGADYFYTLAAADLQLEPGLLSQLTIDLAPLQGLSWNPQNLTISGQAEQAGEFVFPAQVQLKRDGHLHPTELTRLLLLTVNPDPRSLWKNLDADPSQLYFKQNQDSDSLLLKTSPAKRMLAASQRGRSHAHTGTCRDDDFALAELPGDWLLMAVADGAGSARYSRQGSKIACEHSQAYLSERLADPALNAHLQESLAQFARNPGQTTAAQPAYELKKLFYELLPQAALTARKAIESEAARQAEVEPGIASKDYATTLQLCLARQIADQWFFCTFAIGDGMTAVYAPEHGGIHLLAEPDSGEYSGQTRFLTMGSVWSDAESLFQRLKFLLIPDFTACLLMTDGVSDPKFASDQAMQNPASWQPLWEDLSQTLTQAGPPEQRLLEWLNFWSEGEHDDRTLVLLTGGPVC